MELRILSLNVLGPNFAAPKYYPPGSNLDDEYRLQRLLVFLQERKEYCDVIALQEITRDTDVLYETEVVHKRGTYEHIKALLNEEFHCMFIPHARHHWIECVKNECKDPRFPYSYIDNGNALFIRKSSVIPSSRSEVPLPGGNNAVRVVFISHGYKFRITNIHFESESQSLRLLQFMSMIESLKDDVDYDICLGDFNTILNIPPYPEILKLYNWRVDSNTSPTFTLLSPNVNHNSIDHVIYRGNFTLKQFNVLNQEIWEKFPDDATAAERLNLNIDICGSDHLPIYAVFSY